MLRTRSQCHGALHGGDEVVEYFIVGPYVVGLSSTADRDPGAGPCVVLVGVRHAEGLLEAIERPAGVAVLLGELDDLCAICIEQVFERSLSYEFQGRTGEPTPGTLEHRVHQLDYSSHVLTVGCCSLDRHNRLLHLIRELQNSRLEFVYDARPGQKVVELR
jgi:hypothetical protein